MHNKTRFILPPVQVAFAIGLTASNFLRPDLIGGPSWTAPDRQFCDALKGPATLVRFFLLRIAARIFPRYYPVEFVLETIIYFALVGLLWYAVSVEIDAKGQSILAPATGARGTTDVLAMLFGVVLMVLGFLVRRQFGLVNLYSNLVAIPYFIWGAVIAMFYGIDLRRSFAAK